MNWAGQNRSPLPGDIEGNLTEAEMCRSASASAMLTLRLRLSNYCCVNPKEESWRRCHARLLDIQTELRVGARRQLDEDPRQGEVRVLGLAKPIPSSGLDQSIVPVEVE